MKKVDSNYDFIGMEHDVLDFWEKNKCFEKLVEKNKDGEVFRFLDGPITANNPMGIHHAWGRTLKDIFLRYKGMNGYTSHYRNGFDAQGLWIEVEVEKELGFKDKKDIEDYGLDKFTKKCLERVDKFSKTITEQSKRLGQWMDWDNSYFTNTEENITSIWHFLKKCDENGYIKQSFRPMPWCPRCGTSLSDHEMSGSYKEMTHKAVYFKLPLLDTDSKIIVWTTTPWTLSSNVALAVNPEIEYAKVKVKSDDKYVILARNAISMLGDDKVEVVDIFKGEKLVGLKYETCFEELEAQKEVDHKVVAWEDVAADEGTGVVHIAPGCGAEDYELGKRLDLAVVIPVDDSGNFLDGFGFYTGKNAQTVAPEVFEELEKRNKLYKVHDHTHSYPVCWRCKTPVIFKAVREWYIDTDELRPRLIKAAESVKWEPEHIGKRMMDWLNNMGNWAISRKRFYGLPLPFYVCEDCGEVTVIGSREELREKAVDPAKVDALPDLHRPWIDDIKIKCSKCNHEVSRITEVGDCWLDAGIVPFSTLGYFKDKELWRKYYPAEWVTEMKEQIRLWFYSLLFMSVVLEDKAPYEKVLGYSAVVQEDGSKFSKTGFMIRFDDAAEKIGADPARYLYASAPVTSDVRFGYNLGNDARRKLLSFFNIYVFFNTYAVLDNPDLKNAKITDADLKLSDKWLNARVNNFVEKANECMEAYSTSALIKEFEGLVDDISNWYVRINRKRFWKSEESQDKLAAYYTLYNAIKTVLKIMAPIVPFMTEDIWQNMVRDFEPDEVESIHLTDYPKPNEAMKNDKILEDTQIARDIIAMGLLLRNEKQLKVRQPLSKIYIHSKKNVKENVAGLIDVIKEELNIKEIEFIEDEEVLNDTYLTVNFKSAGAVLKNKIQDFKAYVEKMDADETKAVLAKMDADEKIEIDAFGELTKEVFTKQSRPKSNIVVTKQDDLTVAIDTVLTEALIVEGNYRDLVRTIQVLRKEADFKVEQRIELGIKYTGDKVKKVMEVYREKIKTETLANDLVDEIKDATFSKEVQIDGEDVTIYLK